MQAVILCGGKGTRLASLYADRPKILVPIAGRPFIEWQLEWLGKQGITDIHLAGGYKAEVLQQWLEERSQKTENRSQKSEVRSRRTANHESESPHPPSPASPLTSHISHPQPPPSHASPLTSHFSHFTLHLSRFTFNVSLSTEPSPLGTGGGLKYITPWLMGDQFLAINGDSITPELNFSDLAGAHRKSGAAITLAVAQITETGRYGTVEFGVEGRITAFREKAERPDGWINTGVYLIEREALEAIPDNKATSLETELFPALVEQGKLYATPCPPPMLDMGTPAGIKALEAYLSTEARTAGTAGIQTQND